MRTLTIIALAIGMAMFATTAFASSKHYGKHYRHQPVQKHIVHHVQPFASQHLIVHSYPPGRHFDHRKAWRAHPHDDRRGHVKHPHGYQQLYVAYPPVYVGGNYLSFSWTVR